ncbi:magnesium transporter CorA family protein [Holosporaceae bacterium 'Namur']|nr:magnesium transporter CorA family protein [Holosporaceae bacterium 'Namur']
MIIAYININNTLNKIELEPGSIIPEGCVWLDLLEPTIEEEKFIEKSLNIDAPTREEMNKFEVMSPFYKEGDAYYMTVTALHKAESEYPDATAITFIITPNYLVTLRYHRPRPFNNFAARAMRQPEICSSPEIVLEGLIDSLIDRIADALEKSGNELDSILKSIFEKKVVKGNNQIKDNSKFYYNNVIKKVGRTGNVISKNRESLLSINRMLIFYSQIDTLKNPSRKETRAKFKTITREVISLTEYANFLSQRISFLLDATLGMLSVEQNSIIKVFTVAAAVFMPPTLIASIYGMNFHIMPELDWTYGYPIAILFIIISAIAPYYYFKKKGWL